MIVDILTTLHEATLRSLDETDEKRIIGMFTELGVSVLEADFGFVWMRTDKDTFNLAYRSINVPYTPLPPKRGGRNTKVLENSRPDFVHTVEKRKDAYDVSRYMKSFVIIPIAYQHNIYGTIVICFKQPENFSREKRIVCTFIGSNAAHVLTILRNKKATEENEKYRRKIEEEKLRTEFLADAMHEIRTPLAIIKGNVDLALKPHAHIISESAALKSIDTEIRHLTDILSELSVLTTKSSDVRRKIQTKEIKLAPFMRKISQRWTVLARKKNISITIKKIPAVLIRGDASYLNKLFTNVVKNAITYGKVNGHISISGRLHRDTVIIDIHDDGIGISGEDITHIFERFYRADKSRSKNDNQTGLGLAITKWIAEAHGGSIRATSVLGKGATFTISIPIYNKVILNID